MAAGFALTITAQVPDLRDTCRKTPLSVGECFPFWDKNPGRFIYNLVTKHRYNHKPKIEDLQTTLENMRGHAELHNVRHIAMPKIGSGLDLLDWNQVVEVIKDVFTYSGIRIIVYTLDEIDTICLSVQGDPEHYLEDKIDKYGEEFHIKHKQLGAEK